MADTTYTTTVISTGDGRAGGNATSDDGILNLDLAVPKASGGPGGATNPEQLFAAGWASCFHSAVKFVAGQKHVKVEDSSVVAEITLHQNEEGFGLSAVLRLELGGVDQSVADDLAAAAHQVCPYSKATRGNIPVTIEATVA